MSMLTDMVVTEWMWIVLILAIMSTIVLSIINVKNNDDKRGTVRK